MDDLTTLSPTRMHNRVPMLVDAAIEAHHLVLDADGREATARENAIARRLDFGARCNEVKEAAGHGGWTKAREEIEERTGLGEISVLKAMYLANSQSSENLTPERIIEMGGMDAAYDHLQAKAKAAKARKAREEAEKRAAEARKAQDEAKAREDEEKARQKAREETLAEHKAELAVTPWEDKEAVKERHKEEDKAQRQEDRKEARRADPPPDHGNVFCSAIADLDVEAASLDAIFTDPPYPREYLPVWDDLARFAVHALKPGGLLLTLTGHLILPDVLDALRVDGLKYRWTGSLVWRKSRTNIHAAKVSNGSKPFLAFTREGGHPDFYSEDTFHADPFTPKTQADHEWGQDLPLMVSLAREWLRPGWRAHDPFCGAGSLVAAAKEVGCYVTASDVDPDHVITTRGVIS